jgi:RNA polymerase sigma-70 factor (ECF subfamily)
MMSNKPTFEPASPELQQEDDSAQVERAYGDPQAFGALYDRYVQSIYRYLASRLRDGEAAQDLTSQTFLSAFEALPRYRHNGHFPAWLFSIARSKLVDHVRKENRQNGVWLASAGADTFDPLQEIVQHERIAALRSVIESLPEEEQELLRLRYVAELSFSDIAVLLKRNEDAVKKTLYRLLARMHSRMESKHE